MEVPETKKHMNWECPQWENIREKYKGALARRGIRREIGGLPEGEGVTDAFLCCGLVNEDPELRAAMSRIPEETYEAKLPTEWWRKEWEVKETWRDGRLLCASDGSGDFPREERLRRCGYALYYGKEHPWNSASALGGQVQTVPRAELRIFLDIIPRLHVPTTVLCDCLGVVQGMKAILKGEDPRGKEHWDLWGLIQKELQESGNAANLEVEKVKAHLTEDDVKKGVIGANERRLNNEVDEDAKVAGKIQRLPQKNIDDLQRRIAISVLSQKMYVEILSRRLDDIDKLQKAFPIGGPTEYLQYLEGEGSFGEDRDRTRCRWERRSSQKKSKSSWKG